MFPPAPHNPYVDVAGGCISPFFQDCSSYWVPNMLKLLRTCITSSFLVLALSLVAYAPAQPVAAQSIKQQTGIGANNLNKAMKEACLPGGLFNGINNIFAIVTDLDNLLKQLDQALANIIGPLNTNFDPLSCLPNNFNLIGFNPNALQACMNLVPMPTCTFPSLGNIDGQIQSCLSNVVSINNPNINLDQIAQCMMPQVPNITVPDLAGLLDSFIKQIMARIDALGDIINLKNINLAKWFVNFCGQVNSGKIGIQTSKLSGKAKAKARLKKK